MAPSEHNYFYKLDLELKKVWEYPLGVKEVIGSALLDRSGNVYFAVNTGRAGDSLYSTAYAKELYSLDTDGDFRWSREIFANKTREHGYRTHPSISEDDVIYVAGDMFYAFDTDGNTVWSTSNVGDVECAPMIDLAGNIYFASRDDELHGNRVVSLDKNGQERWDYISYDVGWGASSPAFTTDYSHVITAMGQTIISFETASGNVTWAYTVPGMLGDFRASPAVDDQNIIYIGSHGEGDDRQDDSAMYAIKADGSGILWQNNIGSDLYSSPALGNDRVLYVGSEGSRNTGDNQNRLHALDMATGEIIWSAQLETSITWSSPAISNDGTLYVASMDCEYDKYAFLDGKVYSFRTDSTGLLPNCGSPKFHGGNSNTGRRD